MRIRPLQIPVAVGTALSIAAARTVIRNSRRVPRPVAVSGEIAEPVSVLLPARNEAHRITPTLRSLLAQEHLGDLEILVLDDDSTDETAEVVRSVAAGDPRVRVLSGRPLAPGWRGKPHACSQLAEAARGSVLIFVDADVEFAPDAMAAAVSTLRAGGLGLLSPFPHQVMGSALEKLYQPMVAWTWLSNLPARLDPSTGLPSTVVANGQFLVFDSGAYRAIGGHEAVKDAVAEDHAILWAMLGSGAKAAAIDGSTLARCRMYSGGRELIDGYTKWLADWVDTRQKVAWAGAMIALTHLVPPAAALRGSRVGLLGYLAGVAGRVVVARRFAEQAFPSALAHPAACAMSAVMIVESHRRRHRNLACWKGRML